MTRSDDRGESQEHRGSRVWARDDGKERKRAVKKGSDYNGPCVRERQTLTGSGAQATADMGEGRLPSVVGPWCRPWTFGPFLSREKDKKTAATDVHYRSGRRRHDMAAGATVTMTSINQLNKEHALYQ